MKGYQRMGSSELKFIYSLPLILFWVLAMNIEYVQFCNNPKIDRLGALEAELDRVKQMKEQLAKREAKLLVEILRIKKEVLQ